MSTTTPPTTVSSSSSKEKAPTQCSYCDMSFKKLEHAQRHERTHTLDRPYSCAHCGKTFARQDTLNRHARLHSRSKDEVPGSSKAPNRKRRSSVSSVASTSPKSRVADYPTLHAGPSGSGSQPMDMQTPMSPVSPALPFSLSLPVTIPSFPAYSRSAGADLSTFSNYAYARRHSDASYADVLGGLQLDVRPAVISEDPFAAISNAFGLGNEHIASASSPAESSSSSGSSAEGDSPGSSYTTIELDSQYPSPTFTSYSPSSLDDTMSELHAILANDPLHASMAPSSRQKSLDSVVEQPHTPLGGFGDNETFDFDSFASSVEGPAPAPTDPTSALSYETLLRSSETAYPTPPKSRLPSLQHDFDYTNFSSVDRPQLATSPPLKHNRRHSSASSSMSFSTPSLTMPTELTSAAYSPSSDVLASAYATTFPSLSVMPNGLGLHDTSPSILFEAYRKLSGQTIGAAASPAVPAFYIPAENELRSRLPVPMPSWSALSRDGMEVRENSAFIVI